MHDDSIRKRIIDTATRLYVTNGCHKVSMNDISAEMHISKRTIYQHFENKEELLKECFNNLKQQSDDVIRDLRNQIESPIIIMLANFKYITVYSSQLHTLIKDVMNYYPNVYDSLFPADPDKLSGNMYSALYRIKQKGLLRPNVNINQMVHVYGIIMHNLQTKFYSVEATNLIFENCYNILRGILTIEGVKYLDENEEAIRQSIDKIKDIHYVL